MLPIVHALAIMLVSESGFATQCTATPEPGCVGDAAAIFHVIRRRSERGGRTWLASARAYSPRALGRRPLGPGARRGWIPHLRLDGRRPERWPARIPWSRYRPDWRRALDHAQQVVEGRVPDPCPGADGWGMRTGTEYTNPRDVWAWREVPCSAPTLNAFWDSTVPEARRRRRARWRRARRGRE